MVSVLTCPYPILTHTECMFLQGWEDYNNSLTRQTMTLVIRDLCIVSGESILPEVGKMSIVC